IIPPVGDIENNFAGYNAGTGLVALFASIDPRPRDPMKIEPFWSTMTAFVAGGEQFILFAAFGTNERAIYRVDQTRLGLSVPTRFNKVFETSLPPERGYTHVIGAAIGGDTFAVSYDSLSGDVLLDRMNPDNAGGVTPTTVASTRADTAQPWPVGFTGLTQLLVGGEPIVVANNSFFGTVFTFRLRLPTGSAPASIRELPERFSSPAKFLPGIRTHIVGIIGPNAQPALFSYSATDGFGYFHGFRPQAPGLDFLGARAFG